MTGSARGERNRRVGAGKGEKTQDSWHRKKHAGSWRHALEKAKRRREGERLAEWDVGEKNRVCVTSTGQMWGVKLKRQRGPERGQKRKRRKPVDMGGVFSNPARKERPSSSEDGSEGSSGERSGVDEASEIFDKDVMSSAYADSAHYEFDESMLLLEKKWLKLRQLPIGETTALDLDALGVLGAGSLGSTDGALTGTGVRAGGSSARKSGALIAQRNSSTMGPGAGGRAAGAPSLCGLR